MTYINIHTHHPEVKGLTILNVSKDFKQVNFNGFYSMGLHPWFITHERAAEDFIELENVCENDCVLAIGECGLDKVCSTDFALQSEYFQRQILLANRINKPLIIHCVRAYEEVLQMLSENKVNVPVIFHGFNKHLQLAEQIIKQGYYLSLGKYVLTPKGQELVKVLPADKMFLETDDESIEIEVVYKAAALAKQTDIIILQKQIELNAKNVF